MVLATAGEETGEFCVAVGPVTRTAACIVASCMVAYLGGLTLVGSKVKGNALPRNRPQGLCVSVMVSHRHNVALR